jgi:hypothetical protein
MSIFTSICFTLSLCLSALGLGLLIFEQLNSRKTLKNYSEKKEIQMQRLQSFKVDNGRGDNMIRKTVHVGLFVFVFTALAAIAQAQVTFDSKEEAEANYNACSLTLFQWVFRGQECEQSLWQAICDETIKWQNHQRGGLWKPVSESTGRPTILLPQEYQDKQIMLLSPTGKPVATAPFRRLTNPDRATFDVSTSNLPFETRVVIMNGDKVECRYVLDPSKRYE